MNINSINATNFNGAIQFKVKENGRTKSVAVDTDGMKVESRFIDETTFDRATITTALGEKYNLNYPYEEVLSAYQQAASNPNYTVTLPEGQGNKFDIYDAKTNKHRSFEWMKMVP